jgi:hypothetical protein
MFLPSHLHHRPPLCLHVLPHNRPLPHYRRIFYDSYHHVSGACVHSAQV